MGLPDIPDFPFPLENLFAVYARFDNQMRIMHVHIRTGGPAVLSVRLVAEFDSTHQAHIELGVIFNVMLRELFERAFRKAGAPDAEIDPRDITYHRAAMHEWSSKLTVFARAAVGKQSGRRVRLLRIRRPFVELVMEWDPGMAILAGIVSSQNSWSSSIWLTRHVFRCSAVIFSRVKKLSQNYRCKFSPRSLASR